MIGGGPIYSVKMLRSTALERKKSNTKIVTKFNDLNDDIGGGSSESLSLESAASNSNLFLGS